MLHGVAVGSVLVLLLGELFQPFPFLAQPFLQLLLLLQQGATLLCNSWRRPLRRFCSSTQAPERPATSARRRRDISTAASAALQVVSAGSSA